MLVEKEHLKSYNNVAIMIRTELKLQIHKRTHLLLQSIEENDIFLNILGQLDILTDRTVYNRLDETLQNERENKLYFIEIALLAPTNIQRKFKEKAENHLPLAVSQRNLENGRSCNNTNNPK